MENPHFLKSIFLSENFSKKDLDFVLSHFKQVSFSKHDYVVRVGNVTNYYFFMESGFARSYAVDLDGNDITTNFFGKGDIVIDWHSYFLKTPSRESIQAIAPCVAWKINFSDFMKLFSIEAFREVGRTRLINNYFDLKNHTVSMIADSAKDRYLNLLKSKPEIVQNVPLKQIATYLGITDSSLSRIRKEVTNSQP